jgi:hypothetical protein
MEDLFAKLDLPRPSAENEADAPIKKRHRVTTSKP